MNVMGIGISAQVNIDIPYGSNNATVDILHIPIILVKKFIVSVL